MHLANRSFFHQLANATSLQATPQWGQQKMNMRTIGSLRDIPEATEPAAVLPGGRQYLWRQQRLRPLS
jgi:hypothetical protein